MALTKRNTGLILGPLLAIILWLTASALPYEARIVAAIMVFCLTFWITEVIPLSMTAFLGVLLAIVTGIADINTAFQNLGHPIILLFIGSFLLARAMTRHSLDKQIALFILSRSFFQKSLFRLFFGFSVVSFVLSMWVSNSVTVAMLLPLVIGVTHLIQQPGEKRSAAVYFLLGTAYSASIGGVSTIIGSPPNLIGVNYLQQQGITIDFLQWMLLALPVSLSMYGFLLLYMRYFLKKCGYNQEVVKQYVAEHQQKQSVLQQGAKITMAVFFLAVALWLVPGFFNLFGLEQAYSFMNKYFAESTVALLAALLLFLIPAKPGEGVLVADDLVRIDWDTILLFGGGMALGQLVVTSGLADMIGQSITAFLNADQVVLLVLILVLLVLFLTEVSSNTAIAITFVPIIIGVLGELQLPLLYPVLGVVFACSFAFMLPVATPPNAIVYGSREVTIGSMVRTGFILNLVGAGLITAYVMLYMML